MKLHRWLNTALGLAGLVLALLAMGDPCDQPGESSPPATLGR